MTTLLRYARYLRGVIPLLWRSLDSDTVDDQITELRREHGLTDRSPDPERADPS